MSVWPDAAPAPSLEGREGALVCVSVSVEPRCLESLLEALAQIPFPINPEIYHDAAIVRRPPGGSESTENVALVEFPAYATRIEQVRKALASRGFDPSCAHVSSMLEAVKEPGEAPLHGEPPFLVRFRKKNNCAAAY